MWEATTKAPKPQAHPTPHNQSLKRARDFSKGKFKGSCLAFGEIPRNRKAKETEVHVVVSCSPCLPVASHTYPASIYMANTSRGCGSLTESLPCARRGLPPILGFPPQIPHWGPCSSEGVAMLLGVGALVMHLVIIIAITLHPPIHPLISFNNKGPQLSLRTWK